MRKKFVIAVSLFIAILMLAGCGVVVGGELDGRWEHVVRPSGVVRVYEFSGRNFTRSTYVSDNLHGSFSGTFSITDHEIEFVSDSGYITVHSFSRTENTITIRGYRYTRV